jgi:hypothetical protein
MGELTEEMKKLKLKIIYDRGGCGTRNNEYLVLVGLIDYVVTNKYETGCEVVKDVMITPKTIPVVILERYHDDNATAETFTLHVFTHEGWKSMKFEIPINELRYLE